VEAGIATANGFERLGDLAASSTEDRWALKWIQALRIRLRQFADATPVERCSELNEKIFRQAVPP